MKFHEKLQYKMRRVIYESNRKRKQYDMKSSFTGQETSHEGKESKGNVKEKVNTMLDEMDACIGEMLESINLPKIKK